MGLIEKIRSFFKKEQVITSTNITRYDTSSISIPKYSELSEDAKKVVDGYIEEVEFEKLDTLILYADEMSEYANANTELLLKLFFRITQKPLESELSRLPDEEIAERRLDALIQREEVGLYKQGLENLQEESTLKAVALEEIERRESKRKFDFLGLFGRAERLKRKNQMELLELATERMKISKKTIEQQIAVVINEIESEEIISTSLDVYNPLQKSSNETLSNTAGDFFKSSIIKKRINEMIEMARLVIPKEVKVLQRLENEAENGTYLNEKEAVKVLARVQRKLDVYAYTHKSDLEQLRQDVAELSKKQKNNRNRENLLKRINEIQTKYKVFLQYLQPDDLNNLYKTKFDVLITGLSKQEESPFEAIKDKEEIAYYRKILETVLNSILRGNNKHFIDIFNNYKDRFKAIQIIREIIEKENGDYSVGKMLKSSRLVNLILAFLTEEGFYEFYCNSKVFDKGDLENTIDNGTIEWADKFPLKTICTLDYGIKNYEKQYYYKPTNQWVDLALLAPNIIYHLKHNIYDLQNNFIIPEGITVLSFSSPKNFYEDIISRKYNLRCPTTLKKIKPLEKEIRRIVLNEGLEEIDDFAFEFANLCDIYFPKSLRRIGKGAFEGCEKLEKVYINEGLNYLGDHAFANTPSLKEFSVPTHKIDIGNSIFGDERCVPNGMRTITLTIRDLNIEKGCLEQYILFDMRRIKSITIMHGENVAIRYNIVDSDDPEKVVKKVGQLIQEYKQRHTQKEER